MFYNVFSVQVRLSHVPRRCQPRPLHPTWPELPRRSLSERRSCHQIALRGTTNASAIEADLKLASSPLFAVTTTVQGFGVSGCLWSDVHALVVQKQEAVEPAITS